MTTVPEGSPARGTTEARLTIGKVLDSLRGEFPDISPSKIRFLEAEGLIDPERTTSGYRTYAQRDIARLRYVLIAQRDRYWPLKVIRDALDAIDRGLPDPGASGNALPSARAPDPDPEVPEGVGLRTSRHLSLTAREVREAVGIDKDTFTALLDYGLLHPDPSGLFDQHDLAVAAAANTLSRHGLEPRHLRPFRTAADREIGLAEQLVATTREKSREDRAAEIVSACLALHVALVKGGLARH
jgi:DNA-binding transcriptional MerR regulator